MQDQVCASCRRPKVAVNCGVCENPLCKNCAEFLSESSFAFMAEIPENLKHSYYCPSCFGAHVEPVRANYDETMARAKEAFIFFATQRKPIPLLKKSKESVRIDECEDRDETILRLAFRASEQGYNAVVQVEVVSEKIRNGGHEKSRWRGVGYPAIVDTEKLERQ